MTGDAGMVGGSNGPGLTAVLGAPLGVASARATIRSLAAQTIADQIELILIVAAPLDEEDLPESVGSLHSCRPIVSASARSAGTVNAIGSRAARAPLVVFCEDHCFPRRDWAKALVSGFDDPDRVAVGPVFANANPDTAVGRADFLMGYAPWMRPMETCDVEMLPGHNSCYRRDALLNEGDHLEALLDAESVFHERLTASGRRLSIIATASVAHLNFSRALPWLRVAFDAGRLFAARRSADWSGRRRALYALGGPLIPLVRLARTLDHCRARSYRPGAATVLVLLLGLAMDACGQTLGYATRSAGTPHDGMDFGRDRFVTAAERRPPSSGSDRPMGDGARAVDALSTPIE